MWRRKKEEKMARMKKGNKMEKERRKSFNYGNQKKLKKTRERDKAVARALMGWPMMTVSF